MLKKHTYQSFWCFINRRFMPCKGTTFNSKPLDNRCFLSQLPPSSLKIQSVDGRTPCAIRHAFFHPTFGMAMIQLNKHRNNPSLWENILLHAIKLFFSCISRNYSSRNFYYHCFSCKLVRLGCENRIVFLHFSAIDADVLEGKNKGCGVLVAFSFAGDSNLRFVVFTANYIEINSPTAVYRTNTFAPIECERKVIAQLVCMPIYI